MLIYVHIVSADGSVTSIAKHQSCVWTSNTCMP